MFDAVPSPAGHVPRIGTPLLPSSVSEPDYASGCFLLGLRPWPQEKALKYVEVGRPCLSPAPLSHAPTYLGSGLNSLCELTLGSWRRKLLWTNFHPRLDNHWGHTGWDPSLLYQRLSHHQGLAEHWCLRIAWTHERRAAWLPFLYLPSLIMTHRKETQYILKFNSKSETK